MVWLSDATDLGHGADFVKELGTDNRAASDHGRRRRHRRRTRAHRADNAAGALTVKVLRGEAGNAESGTVRALDLKGLPLGDAPFAFKSE